MKIIGLTGGIGSGKSTVAQFLKELGAVVVDLDKIGHDAQKKGAASYEQLISAFGKGILSADGEIDRAKLGKIVFNNAEALKKLNSIVHPAIDDKVKEITGECRRKNIKVMVMEAAAMLENERAWQADEVWVVTAPEKAVIPRIKDRPGYGVKEAKARINSQMTNEERTKKADIVINNDGTLEELKNKVKKEWEKLLKKL